MPTKQSESYLLCISNTGFEAALEPRKLYEVLPDPAAKARGFVRIIDEFGEDYLYPVARFALVSLPQATKKALAKASRRSWAVDSMASNDEIIREVHRVKDQIAARFQNNPKAYWAELLRLHANWKKRSSPKSQKRCNTS